jgi:hypothetical protein
MINNDDHKASIDWCDIYIYLFLLIMYKQKRRNVYYLTIILCLK